MRLLKNLLRSKRKPDWLDIGEIGADFQSEMMRRAGDVLGQKDGRRPIFCLVLEPEPNDWGARSKNYKVES